MVVTVFVRCNTCLIKAPVMLLLSRIQNHIWNIEFKIIFLVLYKFIYCLMNQKLVLVILKRHKWQSKEIKHYHSHFDYVGYLRKCSHVLNPKVHMFWTKYILYIIYILLLVQPETYIRHIGIYMCVFQVQQLLSAYIQIIALLFQISFPLQYRLVEDG